MSTILVTGATGFIGKALCKRLIRDGFIVKGTVRSLDKRALLPAAAEAVLLERLDDEASLLLALAGVDTVVHLAARVHILREQAAEPLDEFRRINVTGTEAFATLAAKMGIKRFVFLSSIGVNGTVSGPRPITEDDTSNPQNDYARSKWEAEQRLRDVARGSTMEVVIIRAPLVYGPENPGNFLDLLRVVYRGMVLPFASVNNRRSFIYLGNLVDVLIACMMHPRAAGQTYIVSDGEDVSTPELIRLVAMALDRPTYLVPCPPCLLRAAGGLIGKSSSMERLLESLVVDIGKIRRELGWKPFYTMKEGLRETADWFRSARLSRSGSGRQ